MAFATTTDVVILFEVKTKRYWSLTHKSRGTHGPIQDLIFSPNGQTLLVTYKISHIILWDLPNKRIHSQLAPSLLRTSFKAVFLSDKTFLAYEIG